MHRRQTCINVTFLQCMRSPAGQVFPTESNFGSFFRSFSDVACSFPHAFTSRIPYSKQSSSALPLPSAANVNTYDAPIAVAGSTSQEGGGRAFLRPTYCVAANDRRTCDMLLFGNEQVEQVREQLCQRRTELAVMRSRSLALSPSLSFTLRSS